MKSSANEVQVSNLQENTKNSLNEEKINGQSVDLKSEVLDDQKIIQIEGGIVKGMEDHIKNQQQELSHQHSNFDEQKNSDPDSTGKSQAKEQQSLNSEKTDTQKLEVLPGEQEEEGLNGYHPPENQNNLSVNDQQEDLSNEQSSKKSQSDQNSSEEQEDQKELETSKNFQISINLNELGGDGQNKSDFQKQATNNKTTIQLSQKGEVIDGQKQEYSSLRGRNRPQRENRKRPSHFGFNQCHQCKRTESIDDLVRCKKETCLMYFCYSCIRKSKLKKAPEYPQHLVFPKTEFQKLKETKNFLCLSCKGQCQCKDCNENSLFSDIRKLQQGIRNSNNKVILDIQSGVSASSSNPTQNLNESQSAWTPVNPNQTHLSSKVVLNIPGLKQGGTCSKPQSVKTTPIPQKTYDPEVKAPIPIQAVVNKNLLNNQIQPQKSQNLFANFKVERSITPSEKDKKEQPLTSGNGVHPSNSKITQPSNSASTTNTNSKPQMNRLSSKILSKQAETTQRLQRESKIQAKLATKQMIQNEDDEEAVPSSKPPKVIITSSGRVAKRPRDQDMYHEEISDEIEEEEVEEDDEEESEYERDTDYHVESDVDYDSECFNYDNIKKQILKNPGTIDITKDRCSIDRKRFDNPDGNRLNPQSQFMNSMSDLSQLQQQQLLQQQQQQFGLHNALNTMNMMGGSSQQYINQLMGLPGTQSQAQVNQAAAQLQQSLTNSGQNQSQQLNQQQQQAATMNYLAEQQLQSQMLASMAAAAQSQPNNPEIQKQFRMLQQQYQDPNLAMQMLAMQNQGANPYMLAQMMGGAGSQQQMMAAMDPNLAMQMMYMHPSQFMQPDLQQLYAAQMLGQGASFMMPGQPGGMMGFPGSSSPNMPFQQNPFQNPYQSMMEEQNKMLQGGATQNQQQQQNTQPSKQGSSGNGSSNQQQNQQQVPGGQSQTTQNNSNNANMQALLQNQMMSGPGQFDAASLQYLDQLQSSLNGGIKSLQSQIDPQSLLALQQQAMIDPNAMMMLQQLQAQSMGMVSQQQMMELQKLYGGFDPSQLGIQGIDPALLMAAQQQNPQALAQLQQMQISQMNYQNENLQKMMGMFNQGAGGHSGQNGGAQGQFYPENYLIMANKGKNNKLKRKRGKKFRFFSDQDGTGNPRESSEQINPFEEHSASKKAIKDRSKVNIIYFKHIQRSQLLNEYNTRGKNNIFIDKRIGKTSNRLTEEEKMRLRYMREQRDKLKERTTGGFSKKRQKYNLDDELDKGRESDEDFMGFTHRGRKLENVDDFKEVILQSSDEDDNLDEQEEARMIDKDLKKGKLNEDMVKRMNFGGGQFEDDGRDEDKQKSRKEVFEEIIAKSKAYKMMRHEIKVAGEELRTKLDDEFQDLLPLLNMNKPKTDFNESKLDKTYEKIAYELRECERAQPSSIVMGEREQARRKKEKLEKFAQNDQSEEEEDEDNLQEEKSSKSKKKVSKKREEKELSKREKVVERIQKDALEKYKNDIKVKDVEKHMKSQIDKIKSKKQQKQVEIDSELVSEEEEEDEEDEEELEELEDEEDIDNDDDNGQESESIEDDQDESEQNEDEDEEQSQLDSQNESNESN